MRFPLPLTLQSRVGRRIALLFVVSALLPVAVLAVVGYAQVSRQLEEQAAAQLEQAAKLVGMGLVDQLTSAENALLQAASEAGRDGSWSRGGAVAKAPMREIFAAFAIVDRTGTRALWGEAPTRSPSPEESRSLAAGKRVLRIDSSGSRVWLGTAAAEGAQLWAAINHDHLFRGAAERARIGLAESRYCVRLVGERNPLLCQFVPTTDPQLRAHWDVFLGYKFGVPPWRVEVSQSAAVLAPVAAFRRTFLLSMVTIVGLVILLSSVQVRRSLQPLAELEKGTRRLAQRDFSGTVSVSSGDEFEDLATSFNQMTGDIAQHFRVMTAVNAIDEAALTAGQEDRVASTAARRLCDALECDTVDVYVAGDRPADAWSHVRAMDGSVRTGSAVQPVAPDLDRLRAARGQWLHRGDGGFGWLAASSNDPATLLPLVSHNELVGLVTLYGIDAIPDERLRVARQLSDQLTVGLSNARLIGRLNGLSYGALAALARSVDANSPWTGGHSERVTILSLRIGSRLGLTPYQMDTLHRGGLLHDIGKIGIHSEILDLRGPLSADDREAMERHPSLGAKILAPIAAFAEAIPIVLHHHERMDGAGYPHRLRGEEIPFLARLLTVADVYDALVSERPYRVGWPMSQAIELIQTETGTHFDPQMVEAFLSVLANEGDAARFAPLPSPPSSVRA